MTDPFQRLQAARVSLAAASVTAADSLRGLFAAVQESSDRDLAEHPDLAELNVQLDSLYGEP